MNPFKNKLILIIVLISFSFACKKKNIPYACFSSPTTISLGINTMFNSTCSELVDEFSWDFGDGTSSVDENPIHRFDSIGIYTISLTVKNEFGSDSYSEDIDVKISDTIRHTNSFITLDETWSGGSVHIVTRDQFIDGSTLTIEAGAKIEMGNGISLNIGKNSESGSKLIAEGTATKPIIFTALSDTAVSGEWNYIGFFNGTDNNTSLKYCTLEYGGGYSENRGSIHIDGTSINIDNCTIKLSEYVGISLEYDAYFATFTNNTIESCGNYPLILSCNYVHTIKENNTFTTNTGILVKENTYNQTNEIWLKQTCPYIINGSIFISSTSGAKLTINAGTDINLMTQSGIYVGYIANEYGTLIAQGTSNEPITFSSSASTKTEGDWNYIGFYGGSTNSSLTYTNLEYGGGSPISTGVIFIEDASVSINNCTINYSKYYGIILNKNSYFESFTNNSISNCLSYPIKIYGSNVQTIGTGNIINTNFGIEVKGDDIISTNVTWLKQTCPYVITGDLFIGNDNGSTLNIDAGATLEFKESKALHVGLYGNKPGALIAKGTSINPITFTVYDSTGGASPGNWKGIYFYYGTDTTSILDYCDISYGGYTLTSDKGNINCIEPPNNFPIISNSNISNSSGYGIFKSGTSVPNENGNTFTNNPVGDKNY